ncbi:MAG: hypothetical protein QM751_06295 [Paludibacteraceae bacterium]
MKKIQSYTDSEMLSLMSDIRNQPPVLVKSEESLENIFNVYLKRNTQICV